MTAGSAGLRSVQRGSSVESRSSEPGAQRLVVAGEVVLQRRSRGQRGGGLGGAAVEVAGAVDGEAERRDDERPVEAGRDAAAVRGEQGQHVGRPVAARRRPHDQDAAPRRVPARQRVVHERRVLRGDARGQRVGRLLPRAEDRRAGYAHSTPTGFTAGSTRTPPSTCTRSPRHSSATAPLSRWTSSVRCWGRPGHVARAVAVVADAPRRSRCRRGPPALDEGAPRLPVHRSDETGDEGRDRRRARHGVPPDPLETWTTRGGSPAGARSGA